MKEFAKGGLITVVDDDDHRISDYFKNGWEERKLSEKHKDEADKRMDAAILSANISDRKGRKRTALDKKVNDALRAATFAETESEAVDDGLIKRGGTNNG